jgi:hypothetical protein
MSTEENSDRIFDVFKNISNKLLLKAKTSIYWLHAKVYMLYITMAETACNLFRRAAMQRFSIGWRSVSKNLLAACKLSIFYI